MSKKIVFILLMSTILLTGCKSSEITSNKTPKVSNPVKISTKAVAKISTADAKSDTNTNIIVKNPDKKDSIKFPIITTEETKVTENINSIEDSIDSALDSIDDAKELDLN